MSYFGVSARFAVWKKHSLKSSVFASMQVSVRVMCLNGFRELTFKSAKSCACYHCKKD